MGSAKAPHASPQSFVIAVVRCFRRIPLRPLIAISGEQDAHENHAIRQFVAGTRATQGACGLIEMLSRAVRMNWGANGPPTGTESARYAACVAVFNCLVLVVFAPLSLIVF